MKTPRTCVLVALCVFASCLKAEPPAPEIRTRIKRVSVASSNVASIGYSKKLHALEIEFTRGATYRFFDVPRTVYRQLLESRSKGHFIAANIRGKYRYVHVRTPAHSDTPGVLAKKN